jgi:hypothetical protein
MDAVHRLHGSGPLSLIFSVSITEEQDEEEEEA